MPPRVRDSCASCDAPVDPRIDPARIVDGAVITICAPCAGLAPARQRDERRGRCPCGASVELWRTPSIVDGEIIVRCEDCARGTAPLTARSVERPAVVAAHEALPPTTARRRSPMWLAGAAAALLLGAGAGILTLGGEASVSVGAAVAPSLSSSPSHVEVRAGEPVEPALSRGPSEVPTVSGEAELFDLAEPEALAGGTHWRVRTANGPVHLWIPPDYDASNASEVIYVHGYSTTVDQAWHEHRLARQFRDSGLNALFIAPSAPADNDAPVRWTTIGSLTELVSGLAQVEWPRQDRVVVGHSGAFRTIASWLPTGSVDSVILLDGLYGGAERFREWLAVDRGRRMMIVANETIPKADRFARQHSGVSVARLDRDRLDELRTVEPEARILYLRTGYNHMWLARGGEVIPALLARTQQPAGDELEGGEAAGLDPEVQRGGVASLASRL